MVPFKEVLMEAGPGLVTRSDRQLAQGLGFVTRRDRQLAQGFVTPSDMQLGQGCVTNNDRQLDQGFMPVGPLHRCLAGYWHRTRASGGSIMDS